MRRSSQTTTTHSPEEHEQEHVVANVLALAETAAPQLVYHTGNRVRDSQRPQ